MKKSKNDIFNLFVLIFIVGSVFGTYYEQILHLVKIFFKSGTISWVSRRGLIYGPFSPIYGIAAILIFFLFCFKKRKWYLNFLYGSLLGGIYEYTMGFLQEKIFGTISWDYSSKFLNIDGRTTIPYMIFWGILILIFIYYIYPKINKFYERMPRKTANIIIRIVFIFLLFDISISLIAVSRQTLRHNGYEAKTFIGEFCDQYYDDEYLRRVYDNSRFVKEGK